LTSFKDLILKEGTMFSILRLKHQSQSKKMSIDPPPGGSFFGQTTMCLDGTLKSQVPL
jgi:hypothetical protein